jgi:YggT family protein
MNVIYTIFFVISYAIKAIIVVTVFLMLVRLILNLIDVNPFGFLMLNVRRITDPLVSPMRRGLINFGADPKFAPLVVILLVILLGYFALSLSSTVLTSLLGILSAVQQGSPTGLIGWILYGLLSLYSTLIVIRIVFSWGSVSYANRVMRFLVNVTDPLLLPLRRTIPPVGMFDISALIALLMLWLLQTAVAATLLRGFMINPL